LFPQINVQDLSEVYQGSYELTNTQGRLRNAGFDGLVYYLNGIKEVLGEAKTVITQRFQDFQFDVSLRYVAT